MQKLNSSSPLQGECSRLVNMAVLSSLHNSGFTQDPLNSAVDASDRIQDVSASELEASLTDLRTKLETVQSDSGAFLTQITDQARRLTRADSTLVGLRQGETIACVARSGSLGPALGTPMDGP